MISILDHPSISGRYLFPQDRTLKRPFVVGVNNIELACFHRIVDENGFTLIHFHGNGEAVADYVPHMADVFEDIGLNQLFVEYREYGGSSGEAKLVAMLADGETVMQAAGIAAILPNPRKYSATSSSSYINNRKAKIVRIMRHIGKIEY